MWKEDTHHTRVQQADDRSTRALLNMHPSHHQGPRSSNTWTGRGQRVRPCTPPTSLGLKGEGMHLPGINSSGEGPDGYKVRQQVPPWPP